jgi:hypothetical protein
MAWNRKHLSLLKIEGTEMVAAVESFLGVLPELPQDLGSSGIASVQRLSRGAEFGQLLVSEMAYQPF